MSTALKPKIHLKSIKEAPKGPPSLRLSLEFSSLSLRCLPESMNGPNGGALVGEERALSDIEIKPLGDACDQCGPHLNSVDGSIQWRIKPSTPPNPILPLAELVLAPVDGYPGNAKASKVFRLEGSSDTLPPGKEVTIQIEGDDQRYPQTIVLSVWCC